MCNCGGGFKKGVKASHNIATKKPATDKNSRIISLWKGILNNETYAKAEFVRTYLQKFPHNKHLTENLSKENLHTMYMQLTH